MLPSRMLLWGLQQTWAIEPDYLHMLFAIAAREEGDRAAAAQVRTARSEGLQAVLTADGRPLDGTQAVRMRDGVAVIPVTGPIFRYADFFTNVSGGATIETLAKDFRLALDAPGVRAIVLHIDSPGGEITGVAQFADQVYAARDTKPIVAYVEGLGASAAYWIASAASEIVLDTTALVGSIGVVQALPNPDGRPARTIEIVSSQSPNKRVDVTTEGGRATIQTVVDTLADVFIGDVARNRGVSTEQVTRDFGRGGILVGAAAVAAGMADQIDSLEATLTRLARPDAVRGSSQRRIAVQQEYAMDWNAFWKGMFGAADQATPGVALAAQVAAQRDEQNEGILTTGTDETARLRAELATLKADAATQRTQAAQAWAEAQIQTERYAPAQRAHLESLYALADTHGQTAALSALVDAAPVQQRTGERVLPATTPLALDRDETRDVAAEARAQVAAYTKQK